MSIRTRVIALAAAPLAIAVVVALGVSYFAVQRQLVGQLDDSLNSQARLAQGVLDSGALERRDFKFPDATARLASSLPESDAQALALLSPSGKSKIMGPNQVALPATPAALAIATSGTGRTIQSVTTGDATRFRVLTVGASSRGAIQIGRSLQGIDSLLDSLRAVLVIVGLIGVALAGLLGFFVARRITRPVTELSDTVDRIRSTNDLSLRISYDTNDEVGALAENFNRMIAALQGSQSALESSVESQRQLVADASHELRTPVAASLTVMESLLAHPEVPEAKREAMLADAKLSLLELTALISDVIELARGDQALADAEQVRLDELAAAAIERFRRLAPDRMIDAELSPTVVMARPDRLARAINNLLDNAHKYSPESEPIGVKVHEGRIEVTDHGVGVPESERRHVFDRFWRGSTSRATPGSGLGLAIVKQVAESHGGSAAYEADESAGSTFAIVLPGWAPEEINGAP